jgi:hypothetical protein
MGRIPILSDLLPDEGWTCDDCGHHNDDIYNDDCEGCGKNRKEEDKEE